MYLSNRLKLILIAGGAVIVIAAAAYGIQFFTARDTSTPPVSETPSVNTADTTSTTPAEQNTTITQGEQVARTPAPALKPAESALIAIALPFVERMGSYSNQGSYSNLEVLLPFMTASFKQWAEEKIKESNDASYQPIYSGITTSVLSYHVTSLNTNDAQLQMTTQRKESVGTTTNSKVYNQEVEVRMVKEGGVWLVDVVNWK
ncbi:MAG: hypothetical protein AAB870_02700 [Patescibacteria group bacterium]